ncbi:hypothetical protein SMACR_09663 [Sordaria macrospora]|uniref:WGS project CABT00000000 data, contig 2.141 n=2 Tax=Sordaria macrospora TaxID=5147 RepID=F7WCI8_SORMK|nr:uncharacterized protein SMAC_09663 [Sordaria macrospora k-hell]KAA8622057.1 hypothetical protein SMACR_09663 [Sordaria macrospora]WPJ65665.1 hypothetical protein SMAC4_09663 [Sordaria macrospora]CCC05630.1 unnamed protein product [Sordaria macrospora k-hell]
MSDYGDDDYGYDDYDDYNLMTMMTTTALMITMEAEEWPGFAVFEEVEDGHVEHTGYAELVSELEYTHSDDGYPSDHDGVEVPSYGVLSGVPTYIRGHDDHFVSRSQSVGNPYSADRGLMVEP